MSVDNNFYIISKSPMLENRYDDILREYNQEIINLGPANQTMRIELALEIKKILEEKPDLRILEIGVGEGDLTKYLLQYNPDIKLDCLDISPEMIESAKKNLGEENVHFVQDDTYEYLNKTATPVYGIILSAWTIHNFTKKDQVKLFEKIHDKLQKGGAMIIMDKVYTGNEGLDIYSVRLQNKRYRYLSSLVYQAIVEHEAQDIDPEYRMEELQIKEILKEIGFRDIEILDRIERDVLLIARK